MALNPKYTVVFSYPKGDYITIYDTTGLYSGTNTGGWKTPNEDVTDIISATVSCINSLGTEVFTANLFANYPGSTTTEIINLSNYNWELDDDYYNFMFTLITSQGTYSYVYETVYFGNARNCTSNLWFNAFPNEDCSCPNERILGLAKEAQILLYGIKAAATSYNTTNAVKIKNASKKICLIANKYCPQ